MVNKYWEIKKLWCFYEKIEKIDLTKHNPSTDATKQKRLTRNQALLRRLTVTKAKTVFFTDEKIFYVDLLINSQNIRLWSEGRKLDVHARHILVQRAKYSSHVMVSAVDSCFGGKGSLHLVPEKVKVSADFYVNDLLPNLIEDCDSLLPNGYIFNKTARRNISLG